MGQRRSTANPARWVAQMLPAMALALAACDSTPAPKLPKSDVSCLPAPLKPNPKAAGGYQVYLDRSFSMSGYVQPGFGPIALADLLNLLKSSGESRNLPVTYSAFGKKIAPLANAAAAQAFTAPAAYGCDTNGACDNQESLIDQTLEDISANGDDRLSVVVTDLWLDNKSFRGTIDVALGNPLRKILDEGKAIGVLGIDAPYAGSVYDVPHVGKYAGATRRPLFVLLIGSIDEVTNTYRLLASRSPLMRGDVARYALFTAAPFTEAVSPEFKVSGGGIARGVVFRDAERSPEFRMNVATAIARHGVIKATVAATPDGGTELRPGLQWNGELRATSHWWRLADNANLKQCSAGMWNPAARAPDPWKRMPENDMAAAFALDDGTSMSLSVPGHYFMLGELSVKNLYPNPSSRWMEEWSLGDDEATVKAFVASRPIQFKALKLASIAKLMNDELVSLEKEARPVVRFPLVVTMHP